MAATEIWVCLTECRDGDETGVSVHKSRDGALNAARESLRECLDDEDLTQALADFDASIGTSYGAGDPGARIWVSVRNTWVLA